MLQQVVGEAGLALLNCQHFESLLITLFEELITVGAIDPKNRTPDEWVDHLSRRTAGQLAALLRERIRTDGLEDALADAVDARNDLVHRFFLDWMPLPVTPGSAQAALLELDRIGRALNTASKLLEPHMLGLAHCLTGVDFEAVEIEVRSMLDGSA